MFQDQNKQEFPKNDQFFSLIDIAEIYVLNFCPFYI